MDPSVPDVSDSQILILEDEVLILLGLETDLREHGFTQVVSVSTAQSAFEAMERLPIAAALLDIHLHQGDAFAVADALEARGIPFIFASGADGAEVPERFRNVPFVSKPYDIAILATALRAVAPRSSGGP